MNGNRETLDGLRKISLWEARGIAAASLGVSLDHAHMLLWVDFESGFLRGVQEGDDLFIPELEFRAWLTKEWKQS